MLRRQLKILKQNSFFLFGPRGVGKTRYVKDLLLQTYTHYIDLLDDEQFERFSLEPSLLKRTVASLDPKIEWIAIDEIQKIPKLLDAVHSLIESDNPLKYALIGSSARKLKREGANLLAGRAFTYNMYPLTAIELGSEFNLDKALTWGTLPKAYLASDDEQRKLFLRSYVQTYLKEEIQLEQIVRRLEPFRRFLQVAAQSNGKIINFSKIAKDVGANDKTVQNYYQILEDTLIGFFLDPYHSSVRKRQREAPKFYLFDSGVCRALANQLTLSLLPATSAYGDAFEHFLITEIKRRCEYAQNDFTFSYLRTKDDAEIDLIIERPGKSTVLLEIKSKKRVIPEDVRTVNAFIDDFENAIGMCLSLDTVEQTIGKVKCYLWEEGIKKILD